MARLARVAVSWNRSPCPTTWQSTTADSLPSGYPAYNQFSEMQTKVSGSGTLIFYWKIHDNRGYVDYLQWSGAGPIEEEEQEPEWQTVSYTYDPAGRRIEKKVDGTTEVKYVYDGDHILAEYNNAGTLLRKYVHGPCVDEPICMIEASGTYAGTHYYHYDALGSVVAMTNSSGNVVELYEYSVYGQVAASDASHPNRFMFTGREFDKDTGLYYYRARYYHPEVGNFLQADSLSYDAGMHLYRYCSNNPLNRRDPWGLTDSPDVNTGNDYNAPKDERGEWCEENVDRQVKQCKRRVDTSIKKYRKALRVFMRGSRILLYGGCMFLGKGAPPCVLFVREVLDDVEKEENEKIGACKDDGYSYCDTMGDWCKGSRNARPTWRPPSYTPDSHPAVEMPHPWLKSGSGAEGIGDASQG